MKTCGEVLVEILENYGIDTVFGIPGVHTVELYRGLPNTKIRHITPRHEQGAGIIWIERQHPVRRAELHHRNAVAWLVIGKQRVVIHGHRTRGFVVSEREIIPFGIVPIHIEGGAEFTAVNHIMEAQTEPRAAHSQWPDLGVLAVDALGPLRHLGEQMLGDPSVGPGESVGAVAHDVEGLIPLLVARDVEVET